MDSGSCGAAIANGLATVNRLYARGASTRIDAAGTFGLTAGRVGELRYGLAIDSLGAYNRLIPGGSARSSGLARRWWRARSRVRVKVPAHRARHGSGARRRPDRCRPYPCGCRPPSRAAPSPAAFTPPG